MVRPKEFDERTALAAAMQVFWEKGYEATSVSDLTERMEIQRPSLYATFGGKQELFEAALKMYITSSLSYINNKLQSAPTVKESIIAFFQGIVDGSGGNHPEYGCMCVNTMVELAPHHETFAHITREFEHRLTELFQKAIERGVQSGELAHSINPFLTARLLTLIAVGLTVTMKTKPDVSQMDLVVVKILTLLE